MSICEKFVKMKGVLRECKQSFTKFFIIFWGKERSSVLCSLNVNKDSRIFHENVLLNFLWTNSSKCEYKHNLTIFLAMIGFLNNHPVCKYKRATEMNWKGLLVGTSRVGNFAVLPRSWYISILKVAMIPRSVTNLTLQNRSPKHPGTEKYLWPLPDQICKLYVWIWIFAPKFSITILFIFGQSEIQITDINFHTFEFSHDKSEFIFGFKRKFKWEISISYKNVRRISLWIIFGTKIQIRHLGKFIAKIC